MDKAYNGLDWEDRPSTATPLDEINLDAISRGLSIVDDRVINNYNAIQDSVKSVAIDETTGLITMYKNDGTSYGFNLATRIYNTIAANQQAAQTKFSQIDTTFGSVQTMLDDMDLKIDVTAAGANAGIENLRTVITQNDGYYRQEMSGISQHVDQVESYAGTSAEDLRNYINYVSSSITQTTQAIQLSVQSVTSSVSDVSDALNNAVETLEAQINVTSGEIDLKVSKMEVIDDLTHEFAGSGIQITPNRITFASTGSMVVNTENFKLDADGNARFNGHVDMASGSIDGEPLVTAKDDGSGFNVDHANNAWKLRSAKIDDLGTRYYTYMTKNKNLIVSDSHLSGHSASNDRTDECSIGTKNYPWRKGYFKYLRVQEVKNGSAVTHDVLPEGLRMTLDAGDWISENGIFVQEIEVNGINENVYLYIATETETDLLAVYKNRIEVDTLSSNTVTFIAETQPSADVDLILLVEDFVIAEIEPADVALSFDNDAGTLSATWSSPDDYSKFITWDLDTLVIEKWDEDTESWYEVDYEESYVANQYEDTPLIVGGD